VLCPEPEGRREALLEPLGRGERVPVALSLALPERCALRDSERLAAAEPDTLGLLGCGSCGNRLLDVDNRRRRGIPYQFVELGWITNFTVIPITRCNPFTTNKVSLLVHHIPLYGAKSDAPLHRFLHKNNTTH
jgi:hypothetical protein